MKFGILTGVYAGNASRKTEATRSLDRLAEYVCAAEELGFHSVFLVEHHFIGNNQIPSTLPVLAYLAAKTTKIRLGTGVTVLSWHNPALLAEQIASIDQISQGRLDVGIGRGYRKNEFECFGLPMDEARARSEEAYAFLRRAWTTPSRFNHRGRFWTFNDIVIDPPVFQQPHPPMWIGASSIQSVMRAGYQDLNLLLDQVAPPELIGERIAAFKEAREQSGRIFDPQTVCVSRAYRETSDENDQERAWNALSEMILDFRRSADSDAALFRHMLPSFTDSRLTERSAALIGEASEIREKIRRLQSYGTEYIMLADLDGTVEGLRNFMDRIGSHFMSDDSTQRAVTL